MLLNYQAATESQAATYPGYPGKRRRREINLFSSLVSYYVANPMFIGSRMANWRNLLCSYRHDSTSITKMLDNIAPFEYRLAVYINYVA